MLLTNAGSGDTRFAPDPQSDEYHTSGSVGRLGADRAAHNPTLSSERNPSENGTTASAGPLQILQSLAMIVEAILARLRSRRRNSVQAAARQLVSDGAIEVSDTLADVLGL